MQYLIKPSISPSMPIPSLRQKPVAINRWILKSRMLEFPSSGSEWQMILVLFPSMPTITDLQNMPEYRTATDFNHRLGPKAGFFGKTRAKATGQNDCLHDRNPQFELTNASEKKRLGGRPRARMSSRADAIIALEPQA